jgi:N-ethylmaleimide reductase
MDLFTPFQLLNLKNRVVMAPMTRYGCTEDGSPKEGLVNYYLKRADNDLGLIIIESSAINDNHAMAYINGAQFHSKEHVLNWKPLVDKIHEQGAKVWIQLFHAGRLTVKEITKVNVLAPSAIKTFNVKSFWRPEVCGEILHFQTQTKYTVPTKISVKEIKQIIQEFAHSCQLAEQTGFDGVELHGAHGYLLHQFCHSETNQRTDEYNAKDFKFVQELVSACRKATSSKFNLSYRLSLHMVDNSYIRYSEDDLDFGKLIKLLDKEGIDIFHSSEMNAGSNLFGAEEALHQIIRKHTTKPVIVCGQIDSLEKAESLLNDGNVELIAIGRALISNPELVSFFKNDEKYELIKFNYEQHIDKIN